VAFAVKCRLTINRKPASRKPQPRLNATQPKEQGGKTMFLVMFALILVLIWILSVKAYGGFKQWFHYLNRWVSISEKFYQLSKKY
jgi:hypothetical protein